MTSIGPTLPPHLTSKRKREDDDGGDVNSQSRSRSTSLDVEDKRRRVLGPALPPAPIDERPTDPPGGQNAGEESESDDDFGPAPPSRPQDATSQQDIPQDGALTLEADKKAAKKPQREEWMLAPPTDGDWTSRIDPTKLKNRRFNTGKGARAPPPTQASDSNLWTETPEQKRKRLQEEVLGVAKPIASPRVEGKPKQSRAEAQEIEQRIQEYKEKNSKASLYKQHQEKKSIEEDDPSKRAFDREKDIGGSIMSAAKRKEFMNRTTDIGSKFSKGAYL